MSTTAEHYGWVSDPDQSLPQWIELAFPTPETIGTVHLTFDTDMTNPSFLSPLIPYVPQCVRAYDLEALVGPEWVTLASEEDNFQRHRIHRFSACAVTKLRLTVRGTGGDPSARVFEMRAYGPRAT